jgi:type I restriction-modification system DNA methylase subunit
MAENGNGASQTASLGFEAKLFLAADKLRGSMDASEYKHVALGLVFLKYISDAFNTVYEKLAADELADEEDANWLMMRCWRLRNRTPASKVCCQTTMHAKLSTKPCWVS